MFVSGDITAIGSQIKTGLDVALNAADDINLISSQNTQWLEGENSSESGNGTQHNETTIDAGNRISINSGDDTTIAGAQVSGDSVVADSHLCRGIYCKHWCAGNSRLECSRWCSIELSEGG